MLQIPLSEIRRLVEVDQAIGQLEGLRDTRRTLRTAASERGRDAGECTADECSSCSLMDE